MVDREQGGRTNGDHEGDPGVAGVLARAHVRGLEEAHALVIAARLAAGSIREAAPLFGYSQPQMRRRWDQVKEIILIPLGLPSHDDALAALWVALHGRCCTERVFALLKIDSRFTRGSSSDFR